MTDKAALHGSRSAFPNLTPLTAQFASLRDFGGARLIRTPIEFSQLGSVFLTAVASGR